MNDEEKMISYLKTFQSLSNKELDRFIDIMLDWEFQPMVGLCMMMLKNNDVAPTFLIYASKRVEDRKYENNEEINLQISHAMKTAGAIFLKESMEEN